MIALRELRSAKAMSESKIQHGAALVQETSDWGTKHPLGPVHWNVWDLYGALIGEDISANKLDPFLVTRGLLKQW